MLPKGWLEEARPNSPVGLNHGRDPGRVAVDRSKVVTTQQSRVVLLETLAQLGRALRDVSAGEVRGELLLEGVQPRASAQTPLSSSATAITLSVSQPSDRLKASVETSAARKLMRFRPRS